MWIWLRKGLYLLCIMMLISCLYKLNVLYKNFHTQVKPSTTINSLIPNAVHYIFFNKDSIDFITYLSILSVIKVQKPSVIYIHTDKRNFTGKYWNKVLQFSSKGKTDIQISFLTQPTHVYGQKLSSIYHASDISRLHILRKFGGIYLDSDMLILNNVDNLRVYECVVGWPKNQYIGNQLIMAKSDCQFLTEWQVGYKKYRPRDWYYNAGQYPTELLRKSPGLCHTEPVHFGVQNLLHKLLAVEKWIEWKKYYGIHILSRHHDLFGGLDETLVQTLETNFGDIARWIL